MITCVVAMVLAAGGAAGQGPTAKEPAGGREAALGSAITEAVQRFNKEQEKLRDAPRVERVGPDPQEPQMLRATYTRLGAEHQIMKTEAGATPVTTVRMRAVEFEKRATNVNAGDLEKDFAKAPWRQTPRGYVVDMQFQWTGSKWEALGQPTLYPTLGVVGRP